MRPTQQGPCGSEGWATREGLFGVGVGEGKQCTGHSTAARGQCVRCRVGERREVLEDQNTACGRSGWRGGALMGDGGVLQAECMTGSEDSV